VELAHEALVVKWERLAQWLEESREDLVFLSDVGQAAELWDRRGQSNEEVWHGEPLADALKSAERCTAPIPDLVNRFIQAGIRKDRRMIRRKRALISSGIGLLVAVAVVSGIVALALADKEREARSLTDKAQKAHRRAVTQRAQAQLEGARAAADRGNHREARAKLRTSLQVKDSLEARALWWNLGQGTRLSGHTDRVMGVSFSPDGKILATGGYDASIRLWDVAAGTVKKILSGHDAGVMGVAFGPNGRVLASAGRDRTVRLWDMRSGRLRKVFRGHTRRIYAVAIGPDGQLLASAGGDGKVRVWNLVSFKLQVVLKEHTDAVFGLAFSPDSRLLASGSLDGSVRVWNIQAGKQKLSFKGHRATVNGVDFSPDGKFVVSSSADRTVRIWDLKKKTGRVLGRHPGRVYWLAFHPDGRRVGAPGSDETARIWEVSTGKSLVLRGHRGEVNALRFSPDGALAATTSDDGTLRLWHVDTGHPYWWAPVMLEPSLELLTHRGWVKLAGKRLAAKNRPEKWRVALEQRARAASQDRAGRVLCVRTYEHELEMWDTVADRRLFKKSVPGITRVLAVAGGCVTRANRTARLYLRSGGSIKLASGAGAVSVHNDRILVALKGKVLAFDASGRKKRELGGGIGVTAMADSDRWLVLGYWEGGLELVPIATGRARPTFSFEGVPSSAVVRILLGPPGTIIAGYANGLVGMWRLRNGVRLLHTHLHGPVVHMVYRKGKLYAATELGDHAVLDLEVFRWRYCKLMKKVWSAVNTVWRHGRPVAAPPPEGHECLRLTGDVEERARVHLITSSQGKAAVAIR
jgi:WD40 repeat protein